MYHTKEKISNKKMVQITAIIIAIIWAIVFAINYINYTQSKGLIFAIHKISEYEDGSVEEYISFGYTYRIYKRISIQREEFVPIWIGRENPESEPDLPKVEVIKLEDVPSNPRKEDKQYGLLYFYSTKRELLGVYKCINSNGNCEKAYSGWDEYNTKNKDPLTKIDENLHTIGTIHEKYAFVDDSADQESKYGQASYQRIIYLYEFDEGNEHILAKYSDIKESTYDSEKELAGGDYDKFIVKDMESGKWGVIRIEEDGTISEIIPFEYDSIDFDEDTKYYILSKDKIWSVYDLLTKETILTDVTEPIYNIWHNGNLTYYYKTGTDRYINSNTTEVDYKVYRLEDKHPFLTTDRVTEIIERPTCIIYITADDNKLHFMDYGKVDRYQIQLAFSEMHHTNLNNPAFVIWRESTNLMTFRVYKGRELGNDYETYTVNVVNWSYNS